MLLAAWVWQDAIPSYICVNPCYLWETLLCKKLLCFPWVLWEYSFPRISQINTDGWLRLFSHGIHGIHRSLVALIRPRNSRNSQKFGGTVGCVGMAGCHTLLICAFRGFCGRCFSARRFRVFCAFCGRYPCLFCWCSSCSDRRQSRAKTTGFRRQRGYGRMPYPPNLCASVSICGRYFSARRFCAFRGFCGRCLSARRFCAFRGFCGRYFSARRFRVFRAFCGRYFSTRRVSSVGDYSFSMRKRLTMPKTRA